MNSKDDTSGNRGRRRPYHSQRKPRPRTSAPTAKSANFDGMMHHEGRMSREGRYQIQTLPDLIMYPFHQIYRFMQKEVSGGILLVLAAVTALIMSNSVFGHNYEAFLHQHISIHFGSFAFEQSFQHFINDALMAMFFLLVGLEIKREFMEGELASLKQAALPFAAAICGMAVPAIIYIYINFGDTINLRGWAIPVATDIAFAIGIMALLGKRAPFSLKVLLVAIAVIDDLGAILVIAVFYAEGLDYQALSTALGIFLVMLFLNRRGISQLTPYMILGFLLWMFVFKSGLHATLAGVMTAIAVPLYIGKNIRRSPLKSLEHKIGPWVTFVILPVFAFANAGVSFAGMGGIINIFSQPVTLGIFLGLFIGKQLGIFAAIFAMVKLKLSPMPHNCNWGQIHAMSLLCGIGFTMSLFIGGLAFPDGGFDSQVRLGVFFGSLAAAVFGYFLLLIWGEDNPQNRQGYVRRVRHLRVRRNSGPNYRRHGRGGGHRGGQNQNRRKSG